MNTPRTFKRRHIIIAALTTLVSAGVALAAVCNMCNGSGNGPNACFTCKGAGQINGTTCGVCNGRGFSKCMTCRGSGQK